MIAMIDNYDSFTYNLVQYLGELGAELRVWRNDAITPREVLAESPRAIVISPGPGTPADAGISIELVRAAAEADRPLLGVCLGHQAIGEAFGGRIVSAPTLMHGKTSRIRHDRQNLFADLPNPFTATRYHSLLVDRLTLPPELEVTAWTDDELIMGLRHKTRPITGIQFHPESILTEVGKMMLKNFLVECGEI